jgi:amino-acid N-acetyltransferase
MEKDMPLPITFSGIRPGEETDILNLIADVGLSVQDLESEKLVHFIVARIADAVVGAVGLEPVGEVALLRSLAVAVNYRKQAIASRLVAAIEKYARSHGVEALYLLTMDAADFFLKQSYQQIDRETAPAGVQATEEFRTLCPATAQCLCKRFQA